MTTDPLAIHAGDPALVEGSAPPDARMIAHRTAGVEAQAAGMVDTTPHAPRGRQDLAGVSPRLAVRVRLGVVRSVEDARSAPWVVARRLVAAQMIDATMGQSRPRRRSSFETRS